MNIHAAGTRPEPANNAAESARETKYLEDAASYVAAMLAELRHIAGRAGFDKLVKSLDAAYYDAYGALDARARETAPPPRAMDGEKTSNSMEPDRP